MNLCCLNHSVCVPSLGQSQLTHTSPGPLPAWAPKVNGKPEGKGQRQPRLGTRSATVGQGGAHSIQWGLEGGGPSGTPCLISEDLSPYLHSHARTL